MITAANIIYTQIAERTGGSIYIGVVGPVRTGKSTFVKRAMETMVIPHIENIYQKERAIDELPQSGSGRTIMTSEPKFVPEEAVNISPDGTSNLSIRFIDSVGYLIPGAIGGEEEGKPRMITTPWFQEEIPMEQAAELGTKKIMEEHCTVGIVVTTDGSIHDIPREDFVVSESRAINDMKETGKPFVVLINSTNPDGEIAQKLKTDIVSQYDVRCLCVNCLTMEEGVIGQILVNLMYEFPLAEISFYLPAWMTAISLDHPIKTELFEKINECKDRLKSLRDCEHLFDQLEALTHVKCNSVTSVDLGKGSIHCEIQCVDGLFYRILEELTGFSVGNEKELISLLTDLSKVKKSYDKVECALREVQSTGYGIVMPTPEEMHLEVPEIVRKGSNYGVKLKASAPSIHMMRADIETEINPIVGDEKQSHELLQYLLQEYEDTEKLWESNIFGKSVYELVNEGLGSKLKRMPNEARHKLQATLSRVINEDTSSLFCIIVT